MVIVAMVLIGGFGWYYIAEKGKEDEANILKQKNTEIVQLEDKIGVSKVDTIVVNMLISKNGARGEYHVPIELIRYAQNENLLDAKIVAEKSGIKPNNQNVVCILHPVDETKNQILPFRDDVPDLNRLKQHMDSCPSKDFGDVMLRKVGIEISQGVGSLIDGMIGSKRK